MSSQNAIKEEGKVVEVKDKMTASKMEYYNTHKIGWSSNTHITGG